MPVLTDDLLSFYPIKTKRSPEAIYNASLVSVVRGHFHFDTVADDETDETLAHLPRNVGENGMAVLEFDFEHRSSED